MLNKADIKELKEAIWTYVAKHGTVISNGNLDYVIQEAVKEAKEQKREAYYQVLEDIRKSGVCNMYGAAPYLVDLCPELSQAEAKEILSDWMKNYAQLCKKFNWR